jgi:hypothetical protein
MAEPASMSREQIANAVRSSVEKILQGRSEAFRQPGHTIGFVPQPPHWIGIIYNDPKIAIPHNMDKAKTPAPLAGKKDEAQDLAEAIAAAAKSVPGLNVGEAAVVSGRNHVTIGFLPTDAPRDALVE